MRYFKTTILLALILPVMAFAITVPWNKNVTGKIFPPVVTDYVGIGTTSPYAPLSVVGQIVGSYFTATSTTATSTFAGGLNIESGGLLYDFSSDGVVIGNKLTIGSGNPTTVASSNQTITNCPSACTFWASYTQGIQRFALSFSGGTDTYSNGSSNVSLVGNKFDWTAGGSGVDLSISTTGNIGIGTTSPYAMLSVAGQVVGQYFTATSTTATSTFAGDVAIGASGTTGSRLTVTKTSTDTVARNEYGSKILITDTGVTTSGDDYTFGQRIDVTRTGASGANTNTYGVYATVVGDNSGGGAGATYGSVYSVIGTTGDDVYGNYTLTASGATNAYGSLTIVSGVSGAVTNGYGLFAGGGTNGLGITNLYGVDIANGSMATNARGLNINDQGSGSTDYSIYTAGTKSYFGGNVGISTTSPWTNLSVSGSSDLGNFGLAGYFTATSTTATSTFNGTLKIGSTGTSASQGNATLVAGTVTVTTGAAVSTGFVQLTRKTSGGTIGNAITYTITNGSFTITSDSALDTSIFSWLVTQ